MYRRFPGATLPSNNNVAGQQVDELSNSLLHKDSNDHWNRFPLNFTDEQQEQQRCEQTTEPKTSECSYDDNVGGISAEHVTSPPLSSFSVLTKDGDGFGLNFGSLPKENVPMYQHRADHELATPSMDRAMQDAMELVSFKLGQQEESFMSEMPRNKDDTPVSQPEASTKLPSVQCPSISSSDDDDMFSFGGASMTNSSIEYLDNDRGFRKKSREKMRRHEVNIKFEMLISILGLAGRVRKKNILHEAASAIKGLRRECNQLRHDRDRLQQQLDNLATYMQNSERGPSYVAS